MPELANPVIPPTAKFAVSEPPAGSATPVAPAETPAPVASEKPAEASATAKGKSDSVRVMSDRIGEAIKTAEKPASLAEVNDDGQDPLNREIEAETKHMGAKERAAWKKLRYENRDYARKIKDAEATTAKITELETKLAEASKVAPADNQELDALRTRLADAEKILAIKDVESTAEFQTAVTKPRTAIEDMARSLAAKYNVSEADVLRALHDTSDKRSDLLAEVASGMNEVDRYDLYTGARTLKELSSKADLFRANAKETLAQITTQNQSRLDQDTQAQAQMRETAHKTGWTKMQEEVPVLTPAEGDDDVTKNWNAEIANAETFARTSNYNEFDVGSQVAIMHRAAVYPLLAGAVTSLQTELKNAHTELQQLRGSRPGAGGGIAANERVTRKGGPTDFVERINERLSALGH
jgi:hypothetical protein